MKNIRIKRHDKLNIRIDVWQDEYIDNKGKVISARWKLYAYCGNSTRSVAREAISALISSENIDATGKSHHSGIKTPGICGNGSFRANGVNHRRQVITTPHGISDN